MAFRLASRLSKLTSLPSVSSIWKNLSTKCTRPLPKHKWKRGLVVAGASTAVAGTLYVMDRGLVKLLNWNEKRKSLAEKDVLSKMPNNNKLEKKEISKPTTATNISVAPKPMTDLDYAERYYRLSVEIRNGDIVSIPFTLMFAAALSCCTVKSYRRFQQQVLLCDYARAGVWLIGWSGATLYSIDLNRRRVLELHKSIKYWEEKKECFEKLKFREHIVSLQNSGVI